MVEIQHIHMVGLEPFQTGMDRVDNISPGKSPVVGGQAIHTAPHFGRDHHVPALIRIGRDPFANNTFRVAGADVIAVGGIPEGHAQFPGPVQHRKAIVQINTGLITGFRVAEFPGAKTYIRNTQTAFSQETVRHSVKIREFCRQIVKRNVRFQM